MRWSGFAEEGALVDVVLRGRKPTGVRDLLELPAPGAARAVGVREGGRGLRPRVRVLRHPVVPRASSGRGRPDSIEAEVRVARRRRRRRRSCSSRRTSPGTAATSASPGALAPLLRRLDRLAADGPRSACGCSTCTRARSRTRSSSTMLELPTVVPYFDLSLQHAAPGLLRSMKRWGSGDRFLDADRVDPRRRARRRVPLVVHRRVPGRDRGRPRRAARVPPRRARSTGPASSRSRPRTAPPAATLDGVVDPDELAAERLRECGERAGADHPGGTRRARRRRRSRCSSTASTTTTVLVGRTHREAPEIDGVVRIAGDADGRPGRDRRAPRSPARSVPTSTRAPRARVAWRRRDVADGGDEEAVRHRRARDAGELHHPRPPAVRGPDAAPHRATTAPPGSRGRCGSRSACTDGIDGWLARRDGATRSGAFLDPLADKVLTLGGFVALVSRGDVWWVPVALIAAREVVDLGLPRRRRRARASRCRRCGSASGRPFFQMLAVGAFVLPPVTADIDWLMPHGPVGRGRAHDRLGHRHRPARLPPRDPGVTRAR